MSFCLDTSAFIDAWERYYPQDVFPVVWDRMHVLAEQGTICSPEEVYHEMKKKSEGVVQWAKTRKRIFVPMEKEVQASLRQIMHAFPAGFVDPRTSRSGADPVVVAVALARGYVVVTGEKLSGKRNRPKIPDVCRHFRVECCTVMEMFRKLEIAFT